MELHATAARLALPDLQPGPEPLLELGTLFEVSEALAQQLGVPAPKGVLVERMTRDSAAYDAGVRPGDVIVSFNQRPVEDSAQLLRLIADSPIGSTVSVGAYRAGRQIEFKVQVPAMQQRRARREDARLPDTAALPAT